MSLRVTVFATLFGVLASTAACGGDDDDNGGGDGVPPAAPSGLEVSALEGGAHLTWDDNSDNEAHFMVFRGEAGGELDVIASPTFDTAQYHDGDVTPGTTYVYAVLAMDEAGVASERSNEVEFTAP